MASAIRPSGVEQGSVPTLHVDLYAPEMVADPWPTLARIREAGPIVWNECGGYWMTARDKICRAILTRPPEIGQEGMIEAFFGKEAFISIDDKTRHRVLLNVWAGAFSRESTAAMAPLIRGIADKLLDTIEPALRAGGRADLMAALCRPLPAYIIAHMMGVGDDMLSSVIAWSDRMADATSSGFPIDYDNDPAWLASERAKAELAAFIIEQVNYRRRSPGADLISQIVHSGIGAELSDEAIMVNTRQLLFAGNETTTKWLGNILMTLGRQPHIRHALDADRALIRPANEEIMRWAGVVHTSQRGVTQDKVFLEGVELPKGTEVMLLLGGANRDPARYEKPDELDIHRAPKPHLSFGFGLHNCLGAVLARAEAFEVTSALLDRFPDYHVIEPVDYGLISVRGPSELWIELEHRPSQKL